MPNGTAGEDAGQWPPDTGRPGARAPFAERERETALLDRLLGQLADGRSALVRIHGTPGTGRSTLLDKACALADTAGIRVAAAHASYGERDLPHGVVAQLHAAVGPLTTGTVRSGTPLELARLFLASARRRPLLIAVDDIQWADEHSWQWLRALARRLTDAPVLLLATRNDAVPPGPAQRLELSPLVDEDRVTEHTLTLGPLSPAGVAEALSHRYGQPVDAGFAAAAAEATGGNPAVLAALVARCARARRPPAAGAREHLAAYAADAVRERTLRTVAVLPVELLDVLRVVAACGPDCTEDTVRYLAELRTTGARRALELLAGTGLLTGGEQQAFRDPAAAGVVLAGLSTERREELCARAAEYAHRRGAPDQTVARLLLASRAVGSAWAVAVLRAEAARRRAAGEARDAERLLQRALREPMPPARRVRVLVELGAVALPADPEAADRHLRRALRTHAGASAGPAWVRAAELLVVRGDAVSAQPLIALLLDRSTPAPADRAALRALYWLAEHSQQGTAHELDRPDTAGLPAEPADPAQAGAAAWRAALLGDAVDRTRRLARTALTGLPGDTAPPTAQLAACHALVLCGDTREARDGAEAVLLRAEADGARPLAGLAHVVLALAHLHEGRAEAAAHALEHSRRAMPEHLWHPLLAPAFAALRALVHLASGAVDAAAAVLAERGAGQETGLARAFWLYARGRVLLARREDAAALADLQECGRLLLARQVLNPALLPWRSAAAEALHRLGDTEAAEHLTAEEGRLTRAWGAAPGHRHGGADAGRPPAPVRPAGPRRRGPRPAPAEPPARGATPGELTDAELRVARLAARGLANRAIAAELAVTLRTVELHLTKTYRKLGIPGRAGLTAALGPLKESADDPPARPHSRPSARPAP
ncbi:AAA family ATPase [Streptomyces gamaensis]|uniref:AAA family ATPase n=1 Tax=Streptomyces gamaensis TaxID=1763542 RepID=A0ABW0Z3Z7_9ACTN